ncbi:hypothetical protein [Streptomyces chrestomyceticus]|uniref:hypothetical protein n=1 Tax=Streptomyces chrestomyceticus TaxID=68185 RepID=UPI0033CC1E25
MSSLDRTPAAGYRSSPGTTVEPPADAPQRQASAAWHPAVWPLLVLVLILVVLLLGAGLFYLTWQHPGLAAPVAAATGVVGVLVAIIALVVRR